MRFSLIFLLLVMASFASAQVEFQMETVAVGFDGATNVSAADVDGDGDMDVLGAAELGDAIGWWEQTEQGWIEHILTNAADGATNVNAADLNGDGNIDIIGMAYNDITMLWYGDGMGGLTYYEVPLYEGAKEAIPWDVDGDGDLDLFVTNYYANHVGWLENIDQPDTWPFHLIDGVFVGSWGCFVGDLDNDGDVDVAATARTADEVAWWENLGGDTWTKHTLDQAFDYVHGMHGGDFGNDGDLDLFAAARNDNTVAMWENDGTGNFVRTNISTTFMGADDVHAIDLDDDGDLDVIGAAITDDDVAWFEYDNGQWIENTIDDAMDFATGVYSVDMDGDGDLDVLGAGYYQDELRIYWRVGEPTPVNLYLTNHTPTIPADGGTIVYDARLVSELPYQIGGVFFWTFVTLPNGQDFGPLYQVQFTLQPFMDITVLGLTQSVPSVAPPGAYVFTGYTGIRNNPALQISDSFDFTKEGVSADFFHFDPAQWSAGGSFVASGSESQSVMTPVSYHVSDAYPNPFNPTTEIAVFLPEAAELNVRVYNVHGQLVSELVSGRVSAGQHAFTFEATELSTGIYFVHTQVPGRLDAVQKVTLLK